MVFEDGIETIPKGAFANCKLLNDITIPASVKTINADAFNGDVSLSKILLPANLQTIGVNAFRKTGLTEVFIPNSVENMCNLYGTSAFNEADKLTKVVFEDGIEVIPKGAFKNCQTLRDAVIPESVKHIKSDAFSNCKSLTNIFLLNEALIVEENAFAGCENLTIFCHINSEVLLYAFKNGINFHLLSEKDPSVDNNVLEMDECSYNLSGTTDSKSSLYFTLKYKIKNDAINNIRNMHIELILTKNLYINDNMGILLNGEKAVFQEKENVITIPIQTSEGTVQIATLPNEYGSFGSYARLCYTKDNKIYYNIIGVAKKDSPVLLINAPSMVSSKSFFVTGTTIPSATIDFFINDQFVGTTTSKKEGSYSIKLSLPADAQFGQRYTVNAVLADDKTVTSSAKMTYDQNAPKLVQFDMYYYAHSQQKIDLLASEGTSLTNLILPGKEFSFDIKFENYEKIGEVYVVSSKNGETKRIKATKIDEDGCYFAEGYFEDASKNYVPGTINIYYTLETDPIDYNAEIDKNDLSEKWQNAKAVINKNTDKDMEVTLTTETNDKIVYTHQELTIEEAYALFIPEHKSRQLKKSYSIRNSSDDEYLEAAKDFGKKLIDKYEDNVISNGEDVIVFHEEKENKWTYIFWDSLKSAVISESITFTGTFWVFENSPGCEWSDCQAAWGLIYDTAKFGMKVNGQIVNINNAEHDVRSNNNLTSEQKEYALKKINQIKWAYAGLDVLRAASYIAKYAIKSGMTVQFGPVAGYIAGAIAGQVFNMLLDLAENYLNDSLEYYVAGGQGTRLKWLIDPSGYIFDATTGERIENAKVTAYWIPNDDSITYWENKPSEDNYGVVWDSDEYLQNNPLYTDNEGYYAWDVPDGWWRVKVEKQCFETVWSEWLPVPPPQTTVNISMISSHKWDSTVITKAATEIEEGIKTITCSICGETKKESIPKIQPQTSSFKKGDVDGNGKIESADARLALRASVHLTDDPKDVKEGTAGYKAADYDGNGKVESSDARKILRVSVNLDPFD